VTVIRQSHPKRARYPLSITRKFIKYYKSRTCEVVEEEIIDCSSTRIQMKNIKTSEIDRLFLDRLVYLVFQNESPLLNLLTTGNVGSRRSGIAQLCFLLACKL